MQAKRLSETKCTRAAQPSHTHTLTRARARAHTHTHTHTHTCRTGQYRHGFEKERLEVVIKQVSLEGGLENITCSVW